MNTCVGAVCRVCGNSSGNNGSLEKIDQYYFCHDCKSWYGSKAAKELLVISAPDINIDYLFRRCRMWLRTGHLPIECNLNPDDLIESFPNDWRAYYCTMVLERKRAGEYYFLSFAFKTSMLATHGLDLIATSSANRKNAGKKARAILEVANTLLWDSWRKSILACDPEMRTTNASCYLTTRESLRRKFLQLEVRNLFDSSDEYNRLLHSLLSAEIELCRKANRPEKAKALRKKAFDIASTLRKQ